MRPQLSRADPLESSLDSTATSSVDSVSRSAEATAIYERAFRENRGRLWSVCYRMTGVAADAEDILQETFARAVRECPDLSRPLGPWLMTVAVRLAKDLLRTRKRRRYEGPWLPGPVETGEETAEPLTEGPHARYDLLESASFAFLLALEALTPMQRAVLLLRDVLDCSIDETAAATAATPGAVKAAHHRARRALERYDRARSVPSREVQERHRQKLEQFLTAMMSGDLAQLHALLAEGVTLTSDAGGTYTAARKIIEGRERAIAFLLGAGGKGPPPTAWEVRMLNGLPALYVEVAQKNRYAPRYVVCFELDADGRMSAVQIVAEPRKLSRIRMAKGGTE
jgi:RNA polymerase sigma-70 factor (ECF subfamily)